jgi:general secretion pathway protein J
VKPRAGSAGVTLLEVIVALTILSLIVVLLVTSLRVGVRAWEAGERRAALQQEMRILTEIVTEALAAAVPFRGTLDGGLEKVVLFDGHSDEVRFVTTAPPMLLDAPAAPFHAVTLRRAGEDQLQLGERLVPNDEPFGEDPHVVLSRSVIALKLEYRDTEGLWQDRWDAKDAGGLPTAVRVGFTIRDKGRADRAMTFIVPIPMGLTS